MTTTRLKIVAIWEVEFRSSYDWEEVEGTVKVTAPTCEAAIREARKDEDHEDHVVTGVRLLAATEKEVPVRGKKTPPGDTVTP